MRLQFNGPNKRDFQILLLPTLFYLHSDDFSALGIAWLAWTVEIEWKKTKPSHSTSK